jgi:hypothetical protein
MKNYREEYNEDLCIDEKDLDGLSIQELWGLLSDTEKKDFENQLQTGVRLDVWQPWWLHDCDPTEELKIPIIKSTKRSHEKIWIAIVDIAYFYCYLTRFYNGEHLSLKEDFSKSLLEVCLSMHTQPEFDSIVDCLLFSIHKIINTSYFVSINYSKAAIDDVVLIIEPYKLMKMFMELSSLDLRPREKFKMWYLASYLKELRDSLAINKYIQSIIPLLHRCK